MQFTLSEDNDDIVILRIPPRRDGSLSLLTATERAVVDLVCAGLTNAEVAARRCCSLRTVANQLASIFKKLEIGSRHELIAVLADGCLDD